MVGGWLGCDVVTAVGGNCYGRPAHGFALIRKVLLGTEVTLTHRHRQAATMPAVVGRPRVDRQLQRVCRWSCGTRNQVSHRRTGTSAAAGSAGDPPARVPLPLGSPRIVPNRLVADRTDVRAALIGSAALGLHVRDGRDVCHQRVNSALEVAEPDRHGPERSGDCQAGNGETDDYGGV